MTVFATLLSALRWRLPADRSRDAAVKSLPEPPVPAPPPSDITPAELVSEFESLGDNCEFGLVQRFCGVEPLGLFRFSGSRIEPLTRALEARLEPIGTEEDLRLDAFYEDDEIQGCSRFYDDFIYHTEVAASTCDLEALRARELQKLGYLKRKLLGDLAAAEKIFVRKEGGFDKAMTLYRVLQGYGPNTLLWVEGEERGFNAGTVETVEPGLHRGHVERLAPANDVPSLDLRGWLILLLEALRVIRGRNCRLAPNNVLQFDETWTFEKLCDARLSEDGPSFADRRVFEVVLRNDTVRADAIVAFRYIETPIAERSLCAFSVWIWVPASFRGSVVDVYFPFSEQGHLHRADLTRRDCWQRVWACTRLPKGQINASAAIRVTGKAGDTIFTSTWHFEDGCLPNEWPAPPA